MPPKTPKQTSAPSQISYRSATLNLRGDNGPATLDENTRSLDITLSTEAPTRVYSWERGVVDEVLLMSGVQMPGNRQLVMLDTHSRWGTSDIIGSARDVRIEGDAMVGRAYFSAAPEAEAPWIKVREGHLTDFSIGYRVDESVWIPEHQTATLDGRTFTGPLQVATRWTPREISAVPIGADQFAKARADASTSHNQQEENQMNPQLRAILESKGLPATATDAEALAYLARMEVKPETPPATSDDEAKRAADEEKIRADATGAAMTRIREIDALCAKYECADMARALIIDGVDLIDAQRKVLDAVMERSKKQNPGTSAVIIADEQDKFRAAANDGLLLRAGLKVEKPAPGAHDLRGYTLAEMARECLRMASRDYRGDVKSMVGRALTTSDFPNILANLATKSLQEAWGTAASTWRTWCGIGSVSDFKTYYNNALSEHDDLEEIPDSGEIKMGGFSEKAPESYKISSYGKKFKITRVMIINDDLGALREMPARRAEAAARKIDDVAYAVLTANGNMGDGHAIFDSTNHANDAVSGYLSAVSAANLGYMIALMKAQKDIAGKRRLNIQPQFFLGPIAIEGAAETFFRSEKWADTNTIATDSSMAATRTNIYSGNYFTRVYEPRLDDDSVTAYYILGPKGKTVKVVFLNGQEGPILEMTQPGFTVEGFEYAVVQDVGAYAVDYRGMVRNEGA